MRLAGRTNFNLLGGHGAGPELSTADLSLALAQGPRDPLARALAFAVATASEGAWADVARLGTGRVRAMLDADRFTASILTKSPKRASMRVSLVFRHAFRDMAVACADPRYSRGAREAKMRRGSYAVLYDTTRAWLQVLADEASVDGNRQLRGAA